MGLHSDWIISDILAMARPWQHHVNKFEIAAAMRRRGFGAIICLQQLGEHASCGPRLLPSTGFTYDPESFMLEGMDFYNLSWEDLGVPTL